MQQSVIKGIFFALLATIIFTCPVPSQASTADLYVMGPGDVLEIIVWREDALSRPDVLVRPDGRISLPLVDDILAKGRTPMQLKTAITKALSEFVEVPKVYVTVKDPKSHSFSVVGHVKTPGTYPMFKPTSVLQALAEAGGFDEWADRNEIKIVRGLGPDSQIFVFDYEKFLDGDAEDKKAKEAQNLVLEPGDVIIVP